MNHTHPIRTITVAGRPIPLSTYLAGIRLAISNPDTLFKSGLRNCGPELGKDIRRDFLRGVHNRINQGVPYIERGVRERLTNRPAHKPIRKLSHQYQTELYRDAQRLLGYGGFGRIITTPEVRKRLGCDHVHTYIGGGHRLCADRECEERR